MPGLRWPWLVSTTGVCAAAAGAGAVAGEEESLLWLLLLAPLLPLLWVAASYGGKADPFAPVIRSTPAGGLRLLLLRTGAVLAISLPLLLAAGLVGVGVSAWAAAWLIPSLTLTLATLVLGSYIGCLPGTLVTGTAWFLLVATLSKLDLREDGRLHSLDVVLLHVLKNLLDAGAQLFWAVAGNVLAVVLMLRRHSFNDARSR
ncbi:hypothetical protein ACIPSE_12375 [Streptomyces sp. NPDC090106]|uniref:hypothetical protein n=1 Tax=Streptomyces sp. NPDC090106 TaxID=3365946 RepID=UPI003823DFF9